jgi:polyisoprenoid-binding protein YceI
MKPIFLFIIIGWQYLAAPQKILLTKEGTIHFKSEAPLELIEATSKKMRGALNPAEQTFAFSVANNSFEGFNSALQREHFNENYMESSKYPTCTFTGKIIEDIDYAVDGTYNVRAKGKLTVHGVEQERIIKATMEIKKGIISVSSSFMVPLADHNITIPKIVNQKIAEEISVELNAVLQPQS